MQPDAEQSPPVGIPRRQRRIVRVSRRAGGMPASIRIRRSSGTASAGTTTGGRGATTINIFPTADTTSDTSFRTPVADLKPQPLLQRPNAIQTEHLEPFRLESSEEPLPSRRIPIDARAEGLECNICYNVMQQPVGCGTPACSARFCRACLAQALAGASSVRCPVCRSVSATATPDTTLQQTLGQGIFVACSHCFDSKVPYPMIEAHTSAICPGVQVACRLAAFGCPWTGPRGENHKETCPLEPIADTFLERFRKEHIQQEQAKHQLFAQIADLRHQVNVRAREPPAQQANDSRNPLNVLSFFFAVMLRRCKGSMPVPFTAWNTTPTRMTVLQTMVLLPTWIVCFVELRASFASLTNGYGPTLKHTLKLCLTMPSMLFLFLKFFPGRGAVAWTFHPRIIAAVATSSMGVLYLAYFSHDASFNVSVGRFISLYFASLVPPLAVYRSCLSQNEADADGWENELRHCAAFGMVKMGLIIAIIAKALHGSGCSLTLIVTFWTLPLLAILLEVRFPRALLHTVRYVLVIFAVCGACSAVGWTLLSIDTIVWACTAFALLFLMLVFMHAFFDAGTWLGSNLRKSSTGTFSDFVGLVALCAWFMALIFLTA